MASPIDGPVGDAFVSTGQLPGRDLVESLVHEAHERCQRELPAKSGIGGGIVTVSPGKGGMGTFAPPLDREGNSVKGQLVAKTLSARLGLDLLISRPAGP